MDDFIQGIEDQKGRFLCKYVTICTKLAKDNKNFYVGLTTTLEVRRYAFWYHVPS